MKQKPKNVAELTGDIVSAYHDLRSGSVTVGEAKEVANLAGKALCGVKVQLEVCKINKTKVPKSVMNFIDTDAIE